jgi:hypothetical protein
MGHRYTGPVPVSSTGMPRILASSFLCRFKYIGQVLCVGHPFIVVVDLGEQLGVFDCDSIILSGSAGDQADGEGTNPDDG